MRVRHLSLQTEWAYIGWMRGFVAFHDRRHPRDLGAADVHAFLTQLAVARKVSALRQTSQASAADLRNPLRVETVRLRLFSVVSPARPGPAESAGAAGSGSALGAPDRHLPRFPGSQVAGPRRPPKGRRFGPRSVAMRRRPCAS